MAGLKCPYLSINGRIRSQIYTYYNYDNGREHSEIPAYCVNPNTLGVPQTVGVGESIEYLADEKTPAIPRLSVSWPTAIPLDAWTSWALRINTKAITRLKWRCGVISSVTGTSTTSRSIPTLSGVELQRAQKMLAAAKDIYARGTAWNEVLSPEVTCTPDRDTAYEVTIDGKAVQTTGFYILVKTWVCDYAVEVSFTDPGSVPRGPVSWI